MKREQAHTGAHGPRKLSKDSQPSESKTVPTRTELENAMKGVPARTAPNTLEKPSKDSQQSEQTFATRTDGITADYEAKTELDTDAMEDSDSAESSPDC
jgi:hypothetical protein